MLAVHADWSMDPRKRWMSVARPHGEGWRIDAPTPVGDLSNWTVRLLATANGGAVALGVDLPLGLPRAYASQHTREPDFPAFLRALRHNPDFFRVCATLDELTPTRPFYPARGVAGMTRASHAEALNLGSPSGLSRHCDRATAHRPAGAPLFWTLGANQTGKAALTAWRDWLLPDLTVETPLCLWPFEGTLHNLLAPGTVTVAETYPAEVMRSLGLKMSGSKRRQSDRVALANALEGAMAKLHAHPTEALKLALTEGFGPDAAGEDRFDSLIGVLGVLAVLTGQQPDFLPDDPWITRWEGWVLGQTALPLIG